MLRSIGAAVRVGPLSIGAKAFQRVFDPPRWMGAVRFGVTVKRDRGEYRPIYEALWDGPDFQSLSPAARFSFVVLKGKCGASGISLQPAVQGALAVWTGHPPRVVEKALRELEQGGWIQREKSVVWVVRGFEFEPTWEASNYKQRTHIQRYLNTLPSLPIVDRWREKYAAWMAPLPDRLSDRLSDGPPEGNRIEDRSPPPTPTPPKPSRRAKQPPDEPKDNWVSSLYEWWTAHIGAITPGQLGKLAKPIHDTHGAEAIQNAAKVYFSPEEGPRYKTPADFFATFAHWHQTAQEPLVRNGDLTERGRKIWEHK